MSALARLTLTHLESAPCRAHGTPLVSWLAVMLAVASATADDLTSLEPADTAIERQSLLTTDRFPGDGWVFFPGKQDARLEETWTLQSSTDGPVLICRGQPHGYLRTTNIYREFEFGLECKFPTDVNGNSGVLVFTDGEDRIWPTSVQVQLHQPSTGSVFGSGGAHVEPEIMKTDLSRPVNQWNELQIKSQQGAVRVQINGKEVGQVKVISPHAGAIGLQSEGSEVHFRHIWIRDLAPVAGGDDQSGAMSCCPPSTCPCPDGGFGFAPAIPGQIAYPPVLQWHDRGRLFVNQPSVYVAQEPRYVAHGFPLARRAAVQHS